MSATRLNRWMDGESGIEELALTLREIAGSRGRLLAAQKLKKGVYRIAIETPRRSISIVAKRLAPPLAHRNRLALEQWLPAAGLDHIAPRLIGVAAERTGRVVWHLYEDLGNSSLAAPSTRPDVEAAIHVIARLHARFAGDPILAECRVCGEDHGIAFYDQHVQEAASAVRLLLTDSASRGRDSDAAQALLRRLERLGAERDDRARALAEFGGPDTLLHGDLWLSNVLVVEDFSRQESFGRRAARIRLIDWDHVGPGSFSYDLSTLMLRFPFKERPRIVDLYRAAAASNGIDIPAYDDLHILFTTAESARIASEATWTALFAREGAQWACEQLGEIDKWFARLDAEPAADRTILRS